MKKKLILSGIVLLGTLTSARAEVEFSVSSSLSRSKTTATFDVLGQSLEVPFSSKATITPPAIGFGYVLPVTEDIKVIPFVESSTLSYKISSVSVSEIDSTTKDTLEQAYEFKAESGEESIQFHHTNILTLGVRLEKKVLPWVSGFGEVAFRPRNVVAKLVEGNQRAAFIPMASELGWYTGAGARFQWTKRISSLHGLYYERDKFKFSYMDNEFGMLRFSKILEGWLFRSALVFTFQ